MFEQKIYFRYFLLQKVLIRLHLQDLPCKTYDEWSDFLYVLALHVGGLWDIVSEMVYIPTWTVINRNVNGKLFGEHWAHASASKWTVSGQWTHDEQLIFKIWDVVLALYFFNNRVRKRFQGNVINDMKGQGNEQWSIS